MAFTYGLYPWTWKPLLPADGDNPPQLYCHATPDAAVCQVDMRPWQEMTRNGQSSGWGFFSWVENAPSDIVSLGSGDCRELHVTPDQRNELKLKLGLSAAPDGDLLVDVLADIFGDKSDPTGVAGPKPIMPTVDGELEIHLSGHSRVWNAAYAAIETLSNKPRGRANKMRDVIRGQLQDGYDAGGAPLVAKLLGDVLLRHKYTRAQIAAGAKAKRTEWLRLLPPGLVSQLAGDFSPVLPQTLYSDNFNGPDSDAIGQQLAWYEYGGYPAGSGWRNISNFAQCVIFGPPGYVQARAEVDVSSVNHDCEVWIVWADDGGGGAQVGPSARFSAAADTAYQAPLVRAFAPDRLYITKQIAGVPTAISYYEGSDLIPEFLVRLRASGSTISAWKSTDGISYTQKLAVTDTSISSGTRGGMAAYRGSSTTYPPGCDSFKIEDLEVATGQPTIKRLGGVPFAHSLGRGVW